MDLSNGYERIAQEFIKVRGSSVNGIGTEEVRKWAKNFSPYSKVLDLGCGTGMPLTKALIEEGLDVLGVDASPTLVKEFRSHFPHSRIECEGVEDSSFFSRKFEGILSWGLIFLLNPASQELVLRKVSKALNKDGKFLFTAPSEKAIWKDLMTGNHSISLGRDRYLEILKSNDLDLIEEFEDSGKNHYFHAMKKAKKFFLIKGL